MNKLWLLDGAMGTMLQGAGLAIGDRPEIFGMEHPDILEKIHKSYIEAGSNVIYANTFGANSHKLKGTGHSVEEVIGANIAIAKKAAGNNAQVALDIGPIGEMLEPLGTLAFEEAYEIYREMVVAGEKAGADRIVFETMTDLYEVKAAVLAAREHTSLPIWVTMSFEKNGRTFTGTTVESMAVTLQGLGVDAMGINCSLGPKEIFPLIEKMSEWTNLPLIVKPNAGLPDPKTGGYAMDAAEFGSQMQAFAGLGLTIMGGCCGTTPDFIASLRNLQPAKVQHKTLRRGVCSSGQMCEFTGVNVIGERINPTGKKRFQQALKEHDLNYIMNQAIEQADGGADILDINVGLPGIDEPQMMVEVVKAVQSVVDLPLQIDSSNPEAIEAGLRVVNGRAIVNSVNAEPDKIASILPIVKKYGAAVIGLTMDQDGIPQSAEKRFELAEYILKEALHIGIPREDLLIDCLTLTISAQQEQAVETLKAVRKVHEELGLHCTLGVSNISFGLPKRNHVTTNFLTQAMCCGLDFPIINPNSKEIMDTVVSYKALSGEDAGCASYIERFANEKTEQKETTGPQEMSVEGAILKGLKEETKNLTKQLLESMSELDVINKKLIPALDVVGEKYEKQEIFLPQLINSANAACAGFDYIKEVIARRGGENVSKGKIIVATVEGDIHDIGKNIVKVVLENYGYQVIDLGRDVPVQKVVETAIEQDVHLIGLSALMTTTVVSMKKTIEALREAAHPCKVFVGGAVLTPEYAKEIGADYYTKDAKASVDVAKEVLE
ncbi:homocysteine S-methyltransferase family protein [Eubacterium oxidoreducens]|uniref:Methionine synthase n=1 Tax=Eubacterium oxidoreducens TaxID=1732 RepID=A0A1G6AWC1_EUBOX|nr:homocysteine S-methyltransferase family protein [Eubacterium oxidoreducens]SDB12609.1 5-methyltetrahydrofolate--homocysteine methyltransferase [Eubacterium oxidoreducens]